MVCLRSLITLQSLILNFLEDFAIICTVEKTPNFLYKRDKRPMEFMVNGERKKITLQFHPILILCASKINKFNINSPVPKMAYKTSKMAHKTSCLPAKQSNLLSSCRCLGNCSNFNVILAFVFWSWGPSLKLLLVMVDSSWNMYFLLLLLTIYHDSDKFFIFKGINIVSFPTNR